MHVCYGNTKEAMGWVSLSWAVSILNEMILEPSLKEVGVIRQDREWQSRPGTAGTKARNKIFYVINQKHSCWWGKSCL